MERQQAEQLGALLFHYRRPIFTCWPTTQKKADQRATQRALMLHQELGALKLRLDADLPRWAPQQEVDG
jgi:hypothetical protein